jgi:L-2,4-diaminobutyrate transaminase
MIVEPVMGAGGVIVPPMGYHKAIRELLDHHDILLIADEVICGFGRLGHMFGSQALDLRPDLITIAKGVTSAYFPLSGCLVSEKVWRTIVDGGKKYGVFGHGYTYSAHPIGAAVGMANLDIVDNDKLVDAAASQGAYMHEQLQGAFADHPMVGDIRGFGLIGAVELVACRDRPRAFDPKLGIAGRVAKKAMQNGVITRALPSADTLAFSPPLVVSRNEIDTLVGGVRDALDAIQQELKTDGVWQP